MDDLSRGLRQLDVLGAKLTGGTPPTYTDPPSPILLLVLTGILGGILAVFFAFAEYTEIKANWAEYQCSPSVMPFAKFYGHDLNATINFCMQQAVKEHAPGVVEPIYKAIGAVAMTVDGVFTKAEAVEGGVSSLLAGFETFVTNFVNSLRLVGTRIRMSVVRIREIFGRVHGIFIAFAYAAISAITFGENLVCNPLVTFMGTITGVDVCCFAPETRVLRADGRVARIDQIRIGDRLVGGSRVCSTYQFTGYSAPMVQIGDIRVSAGHYVRGEDGRMVAAGEHPLAFRIPSLPTLICLATVNHRIPVLSGRGGDMGVGELYDFADYEESSEPEVCAAAQRAAETFLNGPEGVGEPVADYSLGLGAGISVQMARGLWVPITGVSIGDRLHDGGVVAGIIQEECPMVTEMEPGVHVAAAQLLLSPETSGLWQRAGRLWPSATTTAGAAAPRVLHHLLVAGGDNSFRIRTPEGRVFLVRDYSEVDDVSVQEPYDEAVRQETTN